ncbi:glycine/D-amino acid oxidase-like deaminating enzyme [Novosphingobium hassiacum]|uniref:Glycine/D-amino acid oxidase-like deaminating enzyme n=1 Tax=Novosphingobium hassiacum TaxID=173676 RepID=A0A7W5ZYN0_9SPHN|nr:FAD-binding oxidoreductase [Novosphingobium hassiacum]MBB3861567.1 glycine/D-amino acid oxidase-like deaminating enzyme [Novosphingobium hassiacum]
MPAPLRFIKSTPDLPAEADAVVIGGGIIGSFTAYYLAQRGLKVALLEKGVVGGEQSSRNWGWCRQQNRDERELPLATKALDLWEQFGVESGEDTGFRRCGLFYVSNDASEIETWAKWGEYARSIGVKTRMLNSQEASDHGKFTGKVWKGGVHSQMDGIADPGLAVPAVARAVMALGSTVHQACAARGIETTGGAVSGVVTERGTIRTKLVIHAGGAWASSFMRQLGVRFPQATVRQSILAVGTGHMTLPDAFYGDSMSITRRGEGAHALAYSGRAKVDPTMQFLKYQKQFLPMFKERWSKVSPGGLQGLLAGHETLSNWRLDQPTPMEARRILDPVPDAKTIRLTVERVSRLIPAVAQAPVLASWAGFVDSTPDGVPVIDNLPAVPGLILAAGFSGHGFGIGPGASHLVADIATGQDPIVDPRPYRLSRFDGGTKIDVSEF